MVNIKIPHRCLGKNFCKIEDFYLAKNKNYALKPQITKAAGSIGANIAEGNGQFYIKKQLNFFNNALGSASELRHWLVVSLDNGYISKENYDKLEQKTIEIIRMLIGLIKKIQEEVKNEEIA